MPGPSAKKTRKRAAASDRPDTPSRAPKVKAAPNPKADFEAECKRLRDELAKAHARIGELEHNRDQVLDQIAWIVDSLHNLIDD
jgi:hypothetical protein